MPKDETIQPKELQILLPEPLRGGVYANILNANIGPNEVTLNFIYANPNDTPNGTVVSRVIVSRKTASEIAELIKQMVSMAN